MHDLCGRHLGESGDRFLDIALGVLGALDAVLHGVPDDAGTHVRKALLR